MPAPGCQCFFSSSGLTRLKFKFKRGSLPPTMPLEFVGCIGGCDENLKEILGLRFSRGPPRASQPASQPSGYLQASQSLNKIDTNQHSQPQPPASRKTGTSKALAQTLLPPAATGENNSITCNCGQEAVLLTVRKEGPNRGRQFYKCNSSSCNFFLWADSSHLGEGEAPTSSSRPLGGSLGRTPGSLGGFSRPGSGSDSDGNTSCLCNQPAVTRTVQKDGPNKGRQFHTCAKPRDQQCGFFQWIDENVAPGEAGKACSSCLGFHSGLHFRDSKKKAGQCSGRIHRGCPAALPHHFQQGNEPQSSFQVKRVKGWPLCPALW